MGRCFVLTSCKISIDALTCPTTLIDDWFDWSGKILYRFCVVLFCAFLHTKPLKEFWYMTQLWKIFQRMKHRIEEFFKKQSYIWLNKNELRGHVRKNKLLRVSDYCDHFWLYWSHVILSNMKYLYGVSVRRSTWPVNKRIWTYVTEFLQLKSCIHPLHTNRKWKILPYWTVKRCQKHFRSRHMVVKTLY